MLPHRCLRLPRSRGHPTGRSLRENGGDCSDEAVPHFWIRRDPGRTDVASPSQPTAVRKGRAQVLPGWAVPGKRRADPHPLRRLRGGRIPGGTTGHSNRDSPQLASAEREAIRRRTSPLKTGKELTVGRRQSEPQNDNADKKRRRSLPERCFFCHHSTASITKSPPGSE